MIGRMVGKIAHSLSARLLGIFLLTAVIYGFASSYAVTLVLDRDYLREMVGAHISLHTTYLIRDLGSPPSIERAKAIIATNPMLAPTSTAVAPGRRCSRNTCMSLSK